MKTIIKSNRTFGVELEFNSRENQVTIANRINNKFRSLECRGESYNHATQPYWKVITDSSVSSRLGYGLEIVSPILKGKKGMNELIKVADFLNDMDDVEVDVSCGVHVHIDINDATPRQVGNIVKLYAKQSEFIDCVVAPSRRWDGNKGLRWSQNMYRGCGFDLGDNERLWNTIDNRLDQTEGETNVSQINRLADTLGGRYRAVNLTSYRKYGTVEFRQHAGTLDSSKLNNWVVFCGNLVDRAVKANKIYKSATTFEKTFSSSKTLKKFMSKRAVGFGFEQFRVEEDIVRVAGKQLSNELELVKLSNGSFKIFENGVSVDNVKSHLREWASRFNIACEGLTTRSLGQLVLAA